MSNPNRIVIEIDEFGVDGVRAERPDEIVVITRDAEEMTDRVFGGQTGLPIGQLTIVEGPADTIRRALAGFAGGPEKVLFEVLGGER